MAYKRKTKSSVKKRMRCIGSGAIKRGYANKRHGMRKRSNDMRREATGMVLLHPSDEKVIHKYHIPYGL